MISTKISQGFFLAFYLLCIPLLNLHAEQKDESISKHVIIKSINIKDETKSTTIDTTFFQAQIISSLEQANYIYSALNEPTLGINLIIKMWTGPEGIKFCQIKENIIAKNDLLTTSLELYSVIPSTENLTTFCEQTTTRMVRDILLKNKLITKSEISNTSDNIKVIRNPASPVMVDFADIKSFSQIKVKFQPPAPRYPLYAKANSVRSKIVLLMTIDEFGVPIVSSVLMGHPMLDETALAFSMKWRFEPAMINGVNTKAKFALTIQFQ